MSVFKIPAHVCEGSTALDEAEIYIKSLGSKALIVTGPHVGKSPMMHRLEMKLADIGTAYAVFDRVGGEPTDVMVEQGLAVYRAQGCDFVIGLGGGSPIDTAKAVAAMAVLDGGIADYAGCEINGTGIPGIAAIPTTSGTGSEATGFTVITNTETGIKMVLHGDSLVPAVSILDSSNTVDMPKSVTAMTGLDALTHAIESFTSKKATALTEPFAISAVKRIMQYLPAAYHSGFDEEAREQMSLAAYEAGVSINNASVTLVHGMSRPIGVHFHVPHGLSNAMLLADCLDFVKDGATERFALLGRQTGAAGAGASDEAAAAAFIKSVKELTACCEIPTPAEYGIDKDAYYAVMDLMAEEAMKSGSPGFTRKTVTKEDCIELYKKIYG